jgi:hypothetical protein
MAGPRWRRRVFIDARYQVKVLHLGSVGSAVHLSLCRIAGCPPGRSNPGRSLSGCGGILHRQRFDGHSIEFAGAELTKMSCFGKGSAASCHGRRSATPPSTPIAQSRRQSFCPAAERA